MKPSDLEREADYLEREAGRKSEEERAQLLRYAERLRRAAEILRGKRTAAFKQ